MDARAIIRTYLGIAATTTLAQSLIWGVNTLFLLDAGLDIFGVMVANAAFTVSQMFFEVPTGVIADTLGRRASYLLSVATIAVSTLLYVWFGLAGYGVVPFALASALLGLGYTFYTGAVDAWMVDALALVRLRGQARTHLRALRHGLRRDRCCSGRPPAAFSGRSTSGSPTWCAPSCSRRRFCWGSCSCPTSASRAGPSRPRHLRRRDPPYRQARASPSGSATGWCGS